MSGEAYVAVCWGCGQHVSLPLYASVFRCGHCGALTYDYDNYSGVVKPGDTRRKRRISFVKIRDWVTVAFVLLLTTVVITGGGVWSAFPVLFPTFSAAFVLGAFLTALLYLNTVFNFLLTACLPAGPVEPLAWGDVSIVPAGSLFDCTLCNQCDPPKPKPSRAHHCRQCGTCVQDMDHHCPFIGNCVGQSNQRHFMVFLVFAALSCLYAAFVTITAFYQFLPNINFNPVRDLLANFARGSPTSDGLFLTLPSVLWEVLVALQLRGVVLLYVFGVSLGTAACTLILFIQQLNFIFQGGSYIDSLKSQSRGGKAEDVLNGAGYGEDDLLIAPKLKGGKGGKSAKFQNRMRMLRSVFGSGPVWMWLMPRMSHPPGSRAYKQHKH